MRVFFRHGDEQTPEDRAKETRVAIAYHRKYFRRKVAPQGKIVCPRCDKIGYLFLSSWYNTRTRRTTTGGLSVLHTKDENGVAKLRHHTLSRSRFPDVYWQRGIDPTKREPKQYPPRRYRKGKKNAGLIQVLAYLSSHGSSEPSQIWTGMKARPTTTQHRLMRAKEFGFIMEVGRRLLRKEGRRVIFIRSYDLSEEGKKMLESIATALRCW